MTYRTRPGIVYASICGVQLLIPNRAASEFCPNVLRLNILTASVWESIQKDRSMDEMISLLNGLFKLSEEEMHRRIDNSLKFLCEKGALIQVEDKES